jgi:Uma2 family endonuclease
MGTTSGKKLLTAAEFMECAARGVYGDDPRIELIRGKVVRMAPIGARHAGCVALLNTLLVQALAGRAQVRGQSPMWLSLIDMPQPDILIVRPRADFYYAAHPMPPDILLAVEVAETSSRFDRGIKTPLYARAGVVETWIVDLKGRLVEAHRRPTHNGYKEVRLLRPGRILAPDAFPDIQLPVAGLFDPTTGI